jgi:hypothetical protein
VFHPQHRKREKMKPGVVVHACNPSTWEDETGRSQVKDQLELHKVRPPISKMKKEGRKEKEKLW